jgi:hypothetical protein
MIWIIRNKFLKAIFVTMQVLVIRQLRLGLAVMFFIDAPIIRWLLLPATLRLPRDWHW